jgi:hypothetical protein
VVFKSTVTEVRTSRLGKRPTWFNDKALELEPVTSSLLVIFIISSLIPLLGSIPSDLPSRPMRTLLADSAGLSWACFALLWSIIGQRPDPRVLIIPLLIAWCWGAGEGDRNLHLLAPHLLWSLSTLSLQKVGWTRFLGIWITLDAIWLWYAPFFFPSFPWTLTGPITLALHQENPLPHSLLGILFPIILTLCAWGWFFIHRRDDQS